MGRAIHNFKLFLTLTTLFIVMGLLYLTGDALAPSPEDPKKPKTVAKKVKKERGVVDKVSDGSQVAMRKLKYLMDKARREISRMLR